jgi:hypothetical protein
MSHNLRRASIRVVNLASTGLENQIRLSDGPDGVAWGKRSVLGKDEEGQAQVPDLSKALPLRGRTLGCMGPQSKVRLALFNFLVYPCVTLPVLLCDAFTKSY